MVNKFKIFYPEKSPHTLNKHVFIFAKLILKHLLTKRPRKVYQAKSGIIVKSVVHIREWNAPKATCFQYCHLAFCHVAF